MAPAVSRYSGTASQLPTAVIEDVVSTEAWILVMRKDPS
jgi:hypothetical protein